MRVAAARERVTESGCSGSASLVRRAWLAALVLAALLHGLPTPALANPIGAAATHTCALTATGGVQCAGSNATGELGNGTLIPSFTPVDVSGLSSGVTDVTAGGQGAEFSCALTSVGGVKCWGAFPGSLAPQLTPVDVPGLLSGVSTITAGGSHVCALVNGGVKCWGDNTYGQLGDGNSGTSSATPVDVSGLGAGSGVTEIAAGGSHTCAALASAIKCWGRNNAGQLGNGNTTDSPLPAFVSGYATGVRSLAAGITHTCAVSNASAVQCWGDNFNGQLGDGNSNTQSNTPVNVQGLGSGVNDVVVGDFFSCAYLAVGAIKCWGYNWDGEMGDDTRFDRYVPVNVIGLDSGMVGVVAGRSHACAGTDTGAIKCWGLNDQGQLGNGTSTSRLTPVDVVGLGSGVAKFAGNTFSSCALTVGGGVKCWGLNGFGQVGDSTNQNRLTPVDVTGLGSGVTALAVGGRHACALTSTNGVKCWGRNAEGELGRGTFGSGQSTAADVTGLTSGVTAIAAGDRHTCALVNGGIKCWGQNNAGQIGDNSTSDRNLPTDVSGLTSGVTAIATGLVHSCAVAAGGGVKCWGFNQRGALGDGTTTVSLVPVDVIGLASGISTVGAGNYHSCATTNSGGVKCWGGNYIGQLGDGTLVDRPQPVDVLGLASGVATLGSERNQSCVLTNGGGLKCWGSNFVGSLGDGTILTRTAPTDVSGLSSGVTALGKGAFHNCAVTNAGALKCWGDNVYGEIGDGFSGGVLRAADSLFTLASTKGTDLQAIPPLPPPPATSVNAGSSVAVAPGFIVTGAPLATAAGVASSGQVYIYFEGSPAVKTASASQDASANSGFARKALAGINLATLQLPIPLNGDKFGQGGVAINHSGTTVVVGAPGVNNNTGAVYVFQQPVGGWPTDGTPVFPSQPALVPVGSQPGDQVGAALAMTNAGTVIAGAPGATVTSLADAGKGYVMRPKNDGSYNNSSQTLISSLPQANANFGKSITGEGAELAIGAPGQTVNGFVGAGAVVTFREPSQGFDYNLRELIATLNSALDNKFGSSVAMNNGTLVVGAPGVDQPAAPDAGAAVIYDESPTGSMDPVATLTDPTPTSGAALGTSVSVSDQTVAAGAPMADVGSNAGQGDVAVYVPPTFDSSIPIGAIIPTGTLFDPNGSSGNQYGASFVLSPDLAAAGAPEGTTAANRTRGKALADAGPGEVLAYVPNRLFKDSLESIRGALDGCASPNTPILDNDPTGITSDITLTGSGTARQIDVELRIAHTQISDLNVSLTHVPSGITVPLYIPAQSCPHHDIDATFSDRAADGFASSTCNPVDPALDGIRIPKDWLIQFQGQTRAGPWHLTVKDTVATNTGALQFWCVNVR